MQRSSAAATSSSKQQHQASNQPGSQAAAHHQASAASQQSAATAAQQTASAATMPIAMERTAHFNQAQAIVWQIKFILNQISSKKALTIAQTEIESLSAKFGKDFDKYLLRELIEQIDLKDPVKAQKDKNEPFKIQLLTQEFNRCCIKVDFLQYFGDIAAQGFSEKLIDFVSELTKRLKLNLVNQILVSLSLVDSSKEEAQPEAIKILKQKLLDYYHSGRPEPLPDYALHRIVYLLTTHPDLNSDENKDNILQFIVDSSSGSNASQTTKAIPHISLRGALFQDLNFANASIDEPSICLFKDGNGIDNLDKSFKMLEPWQILIDLGHYSSYNYNFLVKTLEDFKDITERTMAKTILYLALNHTGNDDQVSRIAMSTLEANKKGDSSILRKEMPDKKTSMSWSVDNLCRAFREVYSYLNWHKVIEALSEIPDQISLDSKAFTLFLQIIQKSKPQNVPYPLQLILQTQWASPVLQLSFIENSIQFYIEKKEKSIYWQKAGEKRQEIIDELSGIKDKVPLEFLHVWLSVDLVERLLILSDSKLFQRVRTVFEAPLKQIPEYLLLTLSLCKQTNGSMIINELLSLLLPQFLGNHINSMLVLQTLWKNNQALMIRGICELCRHEQRIMNLSRVLDITQEVKESLMPIVDCEDYNFSVNLAILAGKRDFLHYDIWLQRRIQDVGTPFIKALLKYVREHIITPIAEYQRKQEAPANNDSFELHKNQVLERSHLSKEKLAMTIENLQNLQNNQNPLIRTETREQIKEVITILSEYFPNQFSQTQSSEEIDNAANEYFQKVFSAEPQHVDAKIAELIDTMQRFRSSEVKKDQEIYACMLHSLFDEYRFLHKYPNPYLEKIAKLFGAIIKNKIMDGALQEIALKFVLEAFRREGKRMRFGVIVVRHILDMLPQFPQFFESIFEQRHAIQSHDPELIREIESHYETMTKFNSSISSIGDLSIDEPSTSSQAAAGKKQAEISTAPAAPANLGTSQSTGRQEKTVATKSGGVQQQPDATPANAKANDNEFMNTHVAAQQTQQATSVARKDQKASKPSETKQPGSTPISTQAPAFNPTYKIKNANQQPQPSLDLVAPQPNLATQSSTNFGVLPPLNQQTQLIPDLSSGISLQPTTSQGLNPSSIAFSKQRGVSSVNPLQAAQGIVNAAPPSMTFQPSAQIVPPQATASNINNLIQAKPFRPQQMRSPAPNAQPTQQNSQFNQQSYSMQLTLQQKLQKALEENAKVKLEDIIEDSNMPGPGIEQQEEIRQILNNTGKSNFNAKLDQLKAIINLDPSVNANWFIHYILIKRLSSANLFGIYIDLIKQMAVKDSVSITIAQSLDLFKKCMLIDEEFLNQVAQRAQQTNTIKVFLANLGTFIGLLTVAGNRPLYAKELDIKQLLVESFQCNRIKYVITFVSRILKECSKSTIFKYQNPWVKANLEIMKEIYEFQYSSPNNQTQYQDLLFEIDSLFKSFGIMSPNDVPHQNYLKAYYTNFQPSPAQQVELVHMNGKPKLIPTIQNIQQIQMMEQMKYAAAAASGSDMLYGMGPARQSASPAPNIYPPGGRKMIFQQPGGPIGRAMMGPEGGEYDSIQAHQQFYCDISNQQIIEKVVISEEFLHHLGVAPSKLSLQQDQQLRKIVADAVQFSITEILPPVVDRSVTIALITTRELVLKDFAFDANAEKILKAADLIVQNLAGSLALVTCREPLKMQLTTNLKKYIQQSLNMNMFLQESVDQMLSHLPEALINELAQQASKDNLELGCKLIKKAVIVRALTKVREDTAIVQAISQRREITNPQFFKAQVMADEQMLAQFVDLPQQLKPNMDGLTDPQIQVYQDFDRLNNHSIGTGSVSGFGGQPSADYKQVNRENMGGAGGSEVFIQDPNEDIEHYLRQYDQLATFDKRFEQSLVAKINHMLSKIDQSSQEQIKKLMKYSENNFLSICERMSHSQLKASGYSEATGKILDFLGCVSLSLKGAEFDLQNKLTQTFLQFDGSITNNAFITLEVLRRGIISCQKWDNQIAAYIREAQPMMGEQLSKVQAELFLFLKEFLELAVQKDFTYQSFPSVMYVIQKLSECDSAIAVRFAPILQDFRSRTVWTHETLREYFNEWAVISFDEASNPQRQEQEVNRFFNHLRQQGLYKDQKAMAKYCKAMLDFGVEKALFMPDGVTKRADDRLVYRYIESFLQFLGVVLFMYTNSGKDQNTDYMSKHEFFQSVFDGIFQQIDEDHKKRRGDFNQKPYYRILINLLRVINNPQQFNPKTHMLVMFSLADLFNKLNPKEYPAFSFAWLELVSHKLFMPYFLAHQAPVGAQTTAGSGNINQPKRPGQQAVQQPGASGVAGQVQDPSTTPKWLKFKDIIMHLFTFLKNNLIVGQPMTEALSKFYEATLRIVLVIKNDFPEFLVDFHFNFVNSLPDHCIQLRNIILSATPRNIPITDPFSKNLKVDTLQEIYLPPRSQAQFENYLQFQNLREDLERYFRTKEKHLIQVIADKLNQAEEVVNGRRRINSHIFNAVALLIQHEAHKNKQKQNQTGQKECYEMLKQIIVTLPSDKRLCLLNSIVNELRFINAHTYFYSWMVIYMFSDVDESVQEQISRILIERLQTHDPHPWGLCITFRELLQNPKYAFANKSFVLRNLTEIEALMQTKLSSFLPFWQNNRQHAHQQFQASSQNNA